MKLFTSSTSPFSLKRTARKATVAYPSARVTRLNEDFPINILSADGATRWNLTNLRARSQQLEREKGGIGERYLSCVESNVIGPDGIALQLKIKNADGSFDQTRSQEIEEAWKDFGRKGECEVTAEHSLRNFDRISVRSSARDGDLLQLIYHGSAANNDAHIQFQLTEGQYLDESYNVARLPSGNSIRMGVELDAYKRKVAFWIFSRHPGDTGVEGVAVYDGRRRRIPAYGLEREYPIHAIHVSRTKRPEETRAVPWLTPAMDPINMLAGYEEAELVAARGQASMMVVNEREAFAPDGTALEYPDGSSGKALQEFEPGGVFDNPLGVKSKLLNPTHPNQAFPEFTKDYRRKIAAALDCSYNTLFTDLEAVNYSSIRAGLLDEREHWMMTQNWYVETSKQIQFEAWLRMQLLLGVFAQFGVADLYRITRGAIWHPRRWDWVDPLKDIEAAGKAIEYKLSTRTREIAYHRGGDFEAVADELEQEQKDLEARGLDPMINEPKRTAQLIDSADVANVTDGSTSPAIEIASVDIPEPQGAGIPEHHSTRQPRAAGGQFNGPPTPKSQIDELDEEVERATFMDVFKAMAEKAQPQVTVNVPPIQVGSPVVTIENLNLPEQPAPVVNFEPVINVPDIAPPAVTVNVEAPQVNVVNEVRVPQTQRISVERDKDNLLSGINVEKS